MKMIFRNLLLPLVFLSSASLFPALSTESFENNKQGKFTTLDIKYGSMTANADNAEIINSARTGSKALRIMGGEQKELVLKLKNPPSQDVKLRAWVERWTGKGPFEFTITAVSNSGKKIIYDGSKSVKLGGYNTQVDTTLPAKSTEIIFTCTSPDGGGIKLDDLLIVPLIPMKYEGIEAKTDVWPVMVRLDYNPVIQVNIKMDGLLKPLALQEFYLDFAGTTNLKDIEKVDLYQGSVNPEEDPGNLLASSSSFNKDGKMVIKGNIPLEPGDNNLWVSVKMKEKANLDGKVVTKPVGIALGKKLIKIDNPPVSTQRIGIAVTKRGDFNSKFYRIPGLARSKKGTLVAVFDIRYNHSGDLPANIDVGVRRSTDGGRTWSPIAICINDSEIAPKLGATRGVGDPAIMIDEKTGRIWVAAIWSHKHSIWGSKSGDNSPDACGQLVMAYSDDDGVTWSKAINITEQTKDLSWKILFNGPGMGIFTKDGTLVMPAQFWDEKGVPYSTLVYSKDQGKTWHSGTGAHEQTTEAQIVELKDGSLMINARCNWGGSRVVAITKDLGKTWTKHSTNRGALREPVCQGSIIAVENEGAVKRALFFSNPNTGGGRHSMTLKASLDEGDTWPEEKQLLYDQRKCWGYSCLAPVDGKHIGVLYESVGDLLFLRIPYKDILDKK